ncbi:DUF6544 family protein [Halosolutus amylolyticus]|uniref:DUF6544 family protein n=1 Tax=Halosolutus amylolyticus TaxID=2932267 RepID=A0ABD5PRB7_9EURY|nr:DUF6544 family protein [Halosolutus amylolyticus]
MRHVRILKRMISATVALFILGLAGTVWRQHETARRVDELRQSANSGNEAVFTEDDVEGVPDPVREYLTSALPQGQPYVDLVRLEQKGELRLGDASSSWRPFTATQHVTVDPPGFYWDASIGLAPLLSVRVRDLFCDREGTASVSLFGVIPLDRANSSPELEEAELMRYLAEAVWYPTAFLPAAGVEWESIDDSTAKATVEDGHVSASLTFSFNEDDEVTRVHADRYRRVDDGYELTTWSGYWRNYETRNGVRVPTEGEVVWHLPDGDMHAWQGRVTDIQYDEFLSCRGRER